LSSAGRIIISSAASTEKSHRGTRDPFDNVRDGELFTTELFRNLAVGKDLKESFELASTRIEEFTLSKSNSAVGNRTQTPLLDDNADGVGSAREQLSFVLPGDGAAAFGVTLGFGLNSGDSLSWIEATQTLILPPLVKGTPPPIELFARTTQNPPVGTEAWLEVKTPIYSGATPVDGGDAENQQEFLDLTRFDYGGALPADGRFEWSSFASTFDTSGTYKVYYFLRDGDTDEVSAHLLTTIFRQDGSNTAPTAPVLDFPVDNAIIGTTSFFTWAESTDVDLDALTYTIQLTTDPDFTTFDPANDVNDITAEDIPGTFVKLTVADGILDGASYNWRVLAVDVFGASTPSTTTRTVHVDQNNPPAPQSIEGLVVDDVTLDEIEGITVTLKEGGAQVDEKDTDRHGEFAFVNLDPETNYTVDFSGLSYQPESEAVFLPAVGDGVDVGRVRLELNTGVFTWGELNDDGRVGLLDGVDILHWLAGNITFFDVDPDAIPWAPGADVNLTPGIDPDDTAQFLQREVSHTEFFFPADLDQDNVGPDGVKARPYIKDQHTRIVSAPDDLAVSPGDTVTAPILVDDADDVTGYLIDITYDTAVLTYTGFTDGTETQGWLVVENAQTLGQVILVGAGLDAASGSGSLAELHFTVNEASDGLMSVLTLIRTQLNAAGGATIPASAEHGLIKVSGHSTADLNNDGAINAIDIQQIINAVLNQTTTTDLNDDGSTDAADIQLVINRALGVE
jgi:hypothetical protein